MNRNSWSKGCVLAGMLAAMAMCACLSTAADRSPAPVTVELFAAIEQGQIEVQAYPMDAEHGKLVVTNKTDQPLSVALPGALAVVPVLAQIGPRGLPQPQQKQQQPLGAGVANPNGNMFGANGAGAGQGVPGLGNFFNIPPEKVVPLNFKSVCLQHDKAQPNPRTPHEVKPLAAVCDKPELYEVCRQLADVRTNRKALQAAAWHIANGLSWEELAAKRVSKVWWGSEPFYFTKAELKEAKRLAAAAVKKTEDHGKSPASAHQ